MKGKKQAKKRPVPRKGIERPFNGGLWTSARFFYFIRTALRQASNRWNPKFAALRKAKLGKKINEKTGRLAEHYLCLHCKGQFPAKDVAVDHIEDAGSIKSFEDIPGFARRLFCECEGYQVLCLQCHYKKTQQSRIEKNLDIE